MTSTTYRTRIEQWDRYRHVGEKPSDEDDSTRIVVSTVGSLRSGLVALNNTPWMLASRELEQSHVFIDNNQEIRRRGRPSESASPGPSADALRRSVGHCDGGGINGRRDLPERQHHPQDGGWMKVRGDAPTATMSRIGATWWDFSTSFERGNERMMKLWMRNDYLAVAAETDAVDPPDVEVHQPRARRPGDSGSGSTVEKLPLPTNSSTSDFRKTRPSRLGLDAFKENI